MILDRGGVGVPQIPRYLNPGPIADNCGRILSDGFDPIPKNQDTRVIDGCAANRKQRYTGVTIPGFFYLLNLCVYLGSLVLGQNLLTEFHQNCQQGPGVQVSWNLRNPNSTTI